MLSFFFISVMSNTSTILNTQSPHQNHAHQRIYETSTRLHEREIFLLPICFIAVIENILVCLMICYYRNLRTTTNIFIFGLCVTNCLFAGVLLPMHCFQRAKEAYLYLTIIIILIYICNLTAVTIERYIAIIKPLHYAHIITKKRAIRTVIVCYLAPTLYCLLPIAWKAKQKSIVHKVYISITLLVFLIFPLLLILIVYVRVSQETRKFFKKHHNLFTNKSKSANKNNHKSILQEMCFICCLFTKNIKHPSVRYNNELSSDSKSVTSVFSGDFSPKEPRGLGLHKKVRQEEDTIWENTMPTNDESHSLVQYSEYPVNSIMEKIPKRKIFKRSFSLDDSKQRNKVEQENKKSESILHLYHLKKTPAAASLDNLRSGYTRTCKKAKEKLTELKATSAFAMVSITYMFTWLPVIYMTILEVIDRIDIVPHWLGTISIYTIGLNATLDPLLYGFLLRGFRKAIKNTIHRRRASHEWK